MQSINNTIDTFVDDVTIENYKKLYFDIPKALLEQFPGIPIYYNVTPDIYINSLKTKMMSAYINDEILHLDEKINMYNADIYSIYDDSAQISQPVINKYNCVNIGTQLDLDKKVIYIIEYNFNAHTIAHNVCNTLNCKSKCKYNIYNVLFSPIRAFLEPYIIMNDIHVLASQLCTFTISPIDIRTAITAYISTAPKPIRNELYKYFTINDMVKCADDIIQEIANFTLSLVSKHLIHNSDSNEYKNNAILTCGKVITNKRNVCIQLKAKYARLRHVVTAYSSVDYINDVININQTIDKKTLAMYGEVLINLYKYLHKILYTDGPTVIKFDSTLEYIDQIVESAQRVNIHDIDFTFTSGINYELKDRDIVCIYKNAYELYDTNMHIIDNVRNNWKDAFTLNVHKFL